MFAVEVMFVKRWLLLVFFCIVFTQGAMAQGNIGISFFPQAVDGLAFNTSAEIDISTNVFVSGDALVFVSRRNTGLEIGNGTLGLRFGKPVEVSFYAGGGTDSYWGFMPVAGAGFKINLTPSISAKDKCLIYFLDVDSKEKALVNSFDINFKASDTLFFTAGIVKLGRNTVYNFGLGLSF